MSAIIAGIFIVIALYIAITQHIILPATGAIFALIAIIIIAAMKVARKDRLLTNDFSVIDNMKGIEFEEFSGELIAHFGYTNVRVTQSSGDYGVDVTAYKDGIKYAIQCKRYSSKVGIKSVQEVIAGKIHYGCERAIVITNSYFTDNAKTLAREAGVDLWDRKTINEFLIDISKQKEKAEPENKKAIKRSNIFLGIACAVLLGCIVWGIVEKINPSYINRRVNAIKSVTQENISEEAEIKIAQTYLRDLGYYHDEVDGIVGPNTINAIAAFENDHGLPENYEIDSDLISELARAVIKQN